MQVNPRMISLLREDRQLTQGQLGKACNVSQGFISQIEAGTREVTAERLQRLAIALDCPPALLCQFAPVRGGEAGDLHFRRRKTLPLLDRRQIEGKLHLYYLAVRGLLAGIDFSPALPLPDEPFDPVTAASNLRRLWRVPAGPIDNLTAYLEGAGIFLIPCNTSNKVDAVTRRCEEGWHVSAYNSVMPEDRLRLTRAHELGHLVLHRYAGSSDVEDEANLFAAEFLTPAVEILPSLRGLTTRDLGKLIDLRRVWKVSVPFLVRRAKDLGCISDRQYRSFHPILNSRGMLYETVDDSIATEEPALLRRILGVHIEQHGLPVKEVADLALMTPDRLSTEFGLTNSRRLRAV